MLAPYKQEVARSSRAPPILTSPLPKRNACLFLLMFSAERADHCCILGSWVGSAYMGGQP
jgi:hypothetical protein